MKPLRPSAVLVVDDDLAHAHIASLVLRSLAPDLPVALASCASDAVAALDSMPRGGLVLMDRRLGGVESFDTIVQMRACRPDVAVVLVSAALSSIDRAYALACGAVEAFEKPAGLEAWRLALGAVVEATAVAPRITPRAA